jgi:hypothetical protein
VDTVAAVVETDAAARQDLTMWLAYVGAIATIVGVLGFVIGYIDLTEAASVLHVSTNDFGFSNSDYLLLPGWLYLLGAFLVATAYLAYRWGERWAGTVRVFTTWMPIGLAVGFVCIFMARSNCELWFGWLILFPLAGAGLGVTLRRAEIGEAATPHALIWALCFVLVTALVCIDTGEHWAQGLRFYAADGGHENILDSWLTPGRALNPRDVIVNWLGYDTCVVLVGDRVLLTGTRTVVVDKPVSYMRLANADDCKIADDFKVARP